MGDKELRDEPSELADLRWTCVQQAEELARVRAQLDEAAFAAAWAEGQAMTIEQAIEYALNSNDKDS